MIICIKYARILLVLMTLSFSVASGKTIFVDNSLSRDIINGTYSIAKRNSSGRDGNAYTSVQKAVNEVGAGDIIYIRGGRYSEYVFIPPRKQGTEDGRIVMQSYPGEWAIIDGEYKQQRPVILFKDGGHTVCPAYWTFRCFEVTGGGTKKGLDFGGGIRFDTAHHIIFEYLYIHDNYGGNGTNDGGIVIENDSQAAQNITVRYCYLINNVDVEGGNCANISLFSDYVGIPDQVIIENARQGNEIAYNVIIGGQKGIKNKAEQYLCLDLSGMDSVRYKNLGDRYHHNIIKDNNDQAITARQDFVQVYNNIIHSSNTKYKGGISLGSSEFDTEREPFFACVYNNTLIGTGSDARIEHLEHKVYSPPLHPHVYFYNNIFEDIGPEHNGRQDLNIYFTYRSYGEQDVEMRTVHVENNLFFPRTLNENIINLANVENKYTATAWLYVGHSKVLYTIVDTTDIHLKGDPYKYNPAFIIQGDITFGNGGVGVIHPYLDGITIPDYVGAVNPNDGDWVDGLLNDLTNIDWLKARYDGKPPSWIEGT